ncbi:MAG: DUF3343 domain-containing protein [Thermoleophilia bacterium]|nr:DUF3343 domain-containing protein [Thermoleophilia bacterium]
MIFAFPTTHAAMAAEDALRAARLSLQVIPKPPALGAGCGLAIRVAGKDALRACRIFDEHAIRFLPPERVD